MDPTKTDETNYEDLASKIHEAVFANDNESLEGLMKDESKSTEEVDEGKKEEVVEDKPDIEAKPDDGTPPKDETKTDTKAEDKPATNDVEDMATLKEELARLKEIEHRYRSDQGRTPSLQRKIAQYEREIEELRNKTAKTSDNKQESKLAERLAQLREVDPAMADLLEETIGELRGEVEAKSTATKTMFEERELEATLNKEAEKLVSFHPRAFDVFDMPEWQNWKARQTPGVQALAESMYADDVIKAFEIFGKDMNLINPPKQTTSAPAAKAPDDKAPAAPVVDEKAKKTEEERKRKLEAPTSGNKPSPQEGDGLPTDPDKLHDYFYKKALEELGLGKKTK